jgi:hypothetical protein
MKSLKYPDIRVDRILIAAYLAETIEGFTNGLFRTKRVKKFTCPSRAYLLHDNQIIGYFDPSVFDFKKLAESTHELKSPFDCYILDDDEVIEHFEL